MSNVPQPGDPDALGTAGSEAPTRGEGSVHRAAPALKVDPHTRSSGGTSSINRDRTAPR
jgi:hypothetical protein